MDAISSTTTTPAAATPAASAKPSAFASGDFETFLKMLTTQIKNQDPLNPMEGSDFAVQLATFSGVEQQVRTNQLLQGIQTASAGGGLSVFAGWIGKQVRSNAPVQFGASPIRLDVKPDATADNAFLVARDSYGRVVSRDEIGPASGKVDWFGVDEAGQKLADGLYRFSVESWKGETKLSEAKVETFARVEEARTGPEGAVLVLTGGAEVPAAEVSAIREAGVL